MFILIAITLVLAALILRSPARIAPSVTPSVATNLLERANTIKGHNPSEANELRASALAFLSVVR